MTTKVPRYAQFRPASNSASRVKQRNRSRDTKAEVLLRRHVWGLGLRYRLHQEGLPGKPDLVFVSNRVVVFCDGDFWHGRNWEARRRRLMKGVNAEYWIAKIRRNMERDREQTQALVEAGWRVLRLWETDVLKRPEAAVERVREAVLEVRAERGAQMSAEPTLVQSTSLRERPSP